jgi:hypothetical protein
MVAGFTLVNTLINDFMSDALSPWIMNTITDHKTRYIPYSKGVCLLITQCWSVYCNIMGVFGLFLAMTQVDFVLIRMAADLTVNVYTNLKFMRNKVTCPKRYAHSAGQAGADEQEAMVFTDTSHTPMLPEHGASPIIFCIQEDAETG